MTALRFVGALLCVSWASAAAETFTIDWSTDSPVSGRANQTGIELSVGAGIDLPDHDWPGRVVRVEIPADHRVVDAVLTDVVERALPYEASTYVAKPTESIPLERAPGSDDRHPTWLLPEGDLRGHRIAHVVVSPLRRSGDELLRLERFTLDVITEPTAERSLHRRVDHPRTTASDARLLRSLLDADPLPPAADQARVTPPELAPETVEHVIITTTEMATAFQEISDFKTREGIPSIVTTMDWIIANYHGNDLADRVRSYIRDLYLYQGLRYVLLGGDTDYVPTRQVLSRFQAPAGISVTTDKYFGCLDGNWNGNGDAELGEGPDGIAMEPADDVDLYFEVSVGRVPSSTAQEATDFVNKWKSYTGYDPANFRNDYQARMLSLAEVLFPDDWDPADSTFILLDGADISESTLTFVPPAITTKRMYQNSTGFPGSVPEEVDSVIASINDGYGHVIHIGHGFRTNMSVGDGKLVNQTADAFTNTNAYSVLYAINCTSGAIRFDSICEHFILNPSGGAMGAISSTDLDFPSLSEAYQWEFYRLLFEDDVTTLGDAFYQADLPFVPLSLGNDSGYRWTIYTLIALGDPSMEIWRDTPDSLDLAFAPTMDLGDGSFTVTVTDDGSPVEDARVTLYKSDGYGIAMTDAGGVATVDFLPETTGSFQITAVKNSYVPAIDNATINAPVTAALRVDSMVFHDGTGGGGTGNGDNRPDAGESIVVDVTLRNDGSATATGITTTFHANNGFLTVTDSTEASTDILAAGTNTLVGAYAFDVSAALPDTLRHVVVEATTDLIASEGSWTEETPFNIYQRILDLIALDWSISGDDGDGVLESGETAEILLTLENRGEADAVSVVGVGSYTGGLFTFVDDTINFGTIAAGSIVQGGTLRLLSTGGGEADLIVDFTTSDTQGSLALARELDIVRPATPSSISAQPRSDSIELSWPPISDARGYRVYRASAPGGPYTEVPADLVDNGSFYTDPGLAALTSYWYRVAAIDSAGNPSFQSDSLMATTSPPLLEGWPVDLPSGESKGSPTIADVDFDADNDVVLGWSYPMIFRSNGGDFVDGDNDALTSGIFAEPLLGNSKYWNSPAVWDIDNDGVQEVVYCAFQTSGTGHMYVFDATGALETGWPQELGTIPWSTAAFGDIDNDGDYEIFVNSGSGGGTYKGVVLGFHHDGTEVIDGDSDGGTHGIFYKSAASDPRFWYGSVAIADIDADLSDEIVLLEKSNHGIPTASTLYVFNGDGSILTGFPYGAGTLTGSTSSPAVADLDDNGDLEIIAVTDNQVIVVNHDGTDFNGWPQSIPQVPSSSTGVKDFMTSPAIGDINNDGDLDIVLPWLNYVVHAWTGDGGAALANFPAQLETPGLTFESYLHSAVLGNIDADADPEIITGSGDNRLFAVNSDGTAVGGFPLSLSGTVFGSAATWDLDKDGFVDLVVQSDAPTLDVFSFPTVPFTPLEHPWPMFRHDQRKTGAYANFPLVDTDEVEQTTPSVARVGAPHPNPFLPRVRLPFVVPAGGEAVSVRIFDVRGRIVRVLADGRFPAGEFAIAWDGRSETGQRFAPGLYFAEIRIGAETFTRKVTMVR